jgi:hypothetical protein
MSLGLVAGVIGLAGFVPYLVSAWRGAPRPDRATWVVWSVVSSVLAASYVSTGARQTMWVPLGYALGATAIAVLALAKGEGSWTRIDLACLAAAGVSLTVWALSGNPMTALVMNLVVDLFGAVPTLRAVLRDPSSESSAAWSIFLLANTLNLLALPMLSIEHVLYPAYLFALSAAMMAFIVVRPARLAPSAR